MIEIEQTQAEFENEMKSASGLANLEVIQNKYLGRKQGIITKAFQELASLSLDDKKIFGPRLQNLRNTIADTLLAEQKQYSESLIEQPDLSVPAQTIHTGHLHPLTQTQHELEHIFTTLGFTIEEGPEIESDWYNFTALNFPKDHPARDMQDTFYVKNGSNEPLVMRTHTSPMQIRFMKTHKPPFAIVVPGTVYRNEATDATHEHTFEQLEGLVVGQDISFANMVWTINLMFKKFFGDDVKTRLLPTFFPFVEPGAEFAMSSPKFKNGKWVEMGGCGMVHQNVFAAAGYPKGKYQGFAFGFGSTRFPLMKNGIPDIRMLRENNINFLNQF